MQPTPLDAESLGRLSDAQVLELLEAQEALYRGRCRDDITTYTRSVELPGAPAALTEADKKRLAARKIRLDLTVKADREDEQFEGDEEELYGKKVDVGAHHEMILEAIKATVEEEPVYGPMANGMEGTIADGVMIFCPPGAAKSTYASVAAPSYLLGKYRDFDIIGVSYAAELAKRFGRRVRHMCRSGDFQSIFETELREDNQAVDQWSLKNNSSYRAVGIMGGVTGFRANVIIIDDPIAGREEADSELIREKTFQAYKDDICTRLKPNGKIVIIQCMTGDTPVMMADGSWRPMIDVRAGDRIATYDNNKLTSSVVKAFSKQGEDRIYEIRMKSGRRVRANARHPFLSVVEGIKTWQTTASLSPGSVILAVTGANGAASPAQPTAATSQPNAGACATRTTTKASGRRGIERLPSILSRVGRRICDIAMALTKSVMTSCSRSRAVAARFVESPQPKQTPVLIGRGNYASTTVMTLEKLGAYSATTATSPSDTAKHQIFSTPLLDTYEIEEDEVLEIVEAGVEDVFDLQVEGTENFIANGLVSHNTRWHEDDLSGRLLGDKWEGQSGLWKGTDGRVWMVICLPLVAEHVDDPLGREAGEILWHKKPDGTGWFTDRHVELARASGERSWNSLYQQRPSAAEGTILLRKYWKCWPHGNPEPTEDQKANPTATKPPEVQAVFLTYDTAFEAGEENDDSAMTAWGYFEKVVTVKHRNNEQVKHKHIIMLGAWSGKVDSVELYGIVDEHVKLFEPEYVIVEKRASGIQLLQELRRKRPRHKRGPVIVEAWLPPGPPGTKGKRPRAFSAALTMAEGVVWYMPGPKTEAVRKQCAMFKTGTDGTPDDWTDTVTMAISRSRAGFQLDTASDELDEEEDFDRRAREAERNLHPRRVYGSTRLKPVTHMSHEDGDDDGGGRSVVKRRLYGRH